VVDVSLALIALTLTLPMDKLTFSIPVVYSNYVTIHTAERCYPYGAIITYFADNVPTETTLGELSRIGTSVRVIPNVVHTFTVNPSTIIVSPRVICEMYERIVLQSNTTTFIVTTPVTTTITKIVPVTVTATYTTLSRSVNELGITVFKKMTTTTVYTTLSTHYNVTTITTNTTITETELHTITKDTYSNVEFTFNRPAVLTVPSPRYEQYEEESEEITFTTSEWAFHDKLYVSLPVSLIAVFSISPIENVSGSSIPITALPLSLLLGIRLGRRFSKTKSREISRG